MGLIIRTDFCQQQYDKWLMMVRQQTVAALHWIPDPKESSTMKDNTVSQPLLPVT